MSDIINQGLGTDDQITQGLGGSGTITPPPVPEITSIASAVGKLRITLALVLGADSPDGATFNVYRDDTLIEAGVTGDSWSELVDPDNTTHTYAASESDAGGNEGDKFTYSPDITWSAPSGGGGSGGAYPVYISIPIPSVNTPLVFKQGTVGVPFTTMLLHPNGEPIDLTGKLVRLRMQPIAGGTMKINALVVVLLASLGIVSYTFVGTDTDTPGNYNVEFLVTNTDGSPGMQTYPADTYLRLKIIASEG